MTRPAIRVRDELPVRFAAAEDLSVRDCVELAAALAAYARRHGLARVEVSGPPAIGDLIHEFGFEGVRFVDVHDEPALDIPALPRTWRCGHRGLRCLGNQLVDASSVPPGTETPPSTLAEGTALRFARHDRLGDALGIVTGLEHYCRDNAVASVAVTGAPVLGRVVEVFACERVRSVASPSHAVSGDAVFARSSWSMPWLSSRTHPLGPVRRYYDLMRQTSVHAVSQTIADALRAQTGVAAQVLPNLLPKRPVTPTASASRGRCLTLINHHPIKGRAVWDALVRNRPNDTYLVVETWPDVPPYAPPSPTVEVAAFAPDPTIIYRRTRTLLLPSLGPEGLPRVALEAMELGVPVVAHRIGSLPELGDATMFVTPPAITGYNLQGTVLHPVVSPNDIQRSAWDFCRVIDAIDHDPVLRAGLAANGRALVRGYRNRSEAIVDRLLDAWLDGGVRRRRAQRGP